MRLIVLASVMWFLCPTNARAQSPSDKQQIRAVRAEFNSAIARRDLARIVSFLEEGFRVANSAGEFFNSRQEMANAFTGRWVGTWTTPSGPFRTGGRYAAYWRKIDGRWLLHAEMYVPLYCEGSGCR